MDNTHSTNQSKNFNEFESKADIFNQTKKKLSSRGEFFSSQPNDTSLGNEVIAKDPIENDSSTNMLNQGVVPNHDQGNNNLKHNEDIRGNPFVTKILPIVVMSIVCMLVVWSVSK